MLSILNEHALYCLRNCCLHGGYRTRVLIKSKAQSMNGSRHVMSNLQIYLNKRRWAHHYITMDITTLRPQV
ncbi:hypothetical protein I7I48_01238 [Histoplasma ohiense]|nr:hypothetical protein I7I48_01238 [Histoplasma ohiense (nom. inval.)]